MALDKNTDYPQYSLPESLISRPIDILPVGNAMMEMIVKLSSKLDLWGQNDASISLPIYSAGGCATNVACVAARLGANVSIVCRIGDGRYSQPILEEYHRSGVGIDHVKHIKHLEGNLLIIATSVDGDWTALSYMDSELELHQDDIPPLDVFSNTKIMHIDGFAYTSDRQKQAVETAIKYARLAGCLISIDAAVPVVNSQPDYVAELFSKCDLVFANKFEAQKITKMRELDDVIRILINSGPQVSFIKMGSKGSIVVTRDKITHFSSFAIDNIQDTLAAGDSYIAAVLTGLSNGNTLHECVQSGSAAGALACLGSGSLSYHFDKNDIEALIQNQRRSI